MLRLDSGDEFKGRIVFWRKGELRLSSIIRRLKVLII